MQMLCQGWCDADAKTVSLPTMEDQPLTQPDCTYTDADLPLYSTHVERQNRDSYLVVFQIFCRIKCVFVYLVLLEKFL